MKILVHASVVIRDRGQVLLVREGKAEIRGRWNFPGGHVEPGETIAGAATRETREETGLGVFLNDLIRVYTGGLHSGVQSVRFVFGGHAMTGEAAAGDDIQEVRWFPLADLGGFSDDEVVAPRMFRKIVADLNAGITWPVSVLGEEEGFDLSVHAKSPGE